MASRLAITYYASRDMLGMVSDEEYERFKDQLLEALQEEWPDSQISIEDDEEAGVEIDGVQGQAEQDVRDRGDAAHRRHPDGGKGVLPGGPSAVAHPAPRHVR